MINRIRKLLGRTDHLGKDDLARLSILSDEERGPVLFSTLYEVAFQNAAKFVHEELTRPDSIFSGLDRNLFFSEMLVLNFWMMDKVFSKHKQNLAEKMHYHYFGSLSDIEERTAALSPKLKTYSLCWDEYTGHHDEFGIKVGEVLFGKGSGVPEKSVSFWVISYADDSMKRYKKIRNLLKEKQLI